MKRLDEILTYKALSFKYSGTSSAILEAAIESSPEAVKHTKNICAYLSMPLVERFESALGVLGMSKREFIEAALIDALDRFDSIADDHDIFEPHLVEQGGVQ